MKRFLFTIAPLLLGAATASAAGINLGWNDCPDGSSYALTETFVCDTNTGVHTLVGSFVAPAGVVAMSANEFVVDIATATNPLPDWWRMATGYCRAGSLVGNFDFTSGPFACYDYWQGGAIGGIAEDLTNASIGRARIKGVFALPAGDPRITLVPEGTHVYSFKLIINDAKSTGSGSCTGCGEEMCIVLQLIRLDQHPPLPIISLYNPATVQHAVWQAWTTSDPAHTCGGIVPARQKTWGSIKALYR